jgi:hypothetical protein
MFLVLGAALLMICSSNKTDHTEWGFFGHKLINRMAVLSLPKEMMVYFKQHITFLEEHAIDPDKRRYASKYEGIRHHIDLDEWGEFPFDTLPRNVSTAWAKYTIIKGVTFDLDTIVLWNPIPLSFKGRELHFPIGKTQKKFFPEQSTFASNKLILQKREYLRWVGFRLINDMQRDEYEIHPDTLALYLGVRIKGLKSIFAEDKLSTHGILPWHLIRAQSRLTNAFRKKDTKSILQNMADIGHYIGDAHVPLHTVRNYNGQLTGQDGIHGFWESRIPELFAKSEYDFFVGTPEYVEDKENYFWKMVFRSYELSDSVLLIEQRLRTQFPPDRQMCFDERLGIVIRTQCREFSEAYSKAMGTMVEDRMRASILSISSIWYTSWVDAGKPSIYFNEIYDPKQDSLQLDLEASFKNGNIYGRQHEN